MKFTKIAPDITCSKNSGFMDTVNLLDLRAYHDRYKERF